MPNNITIQEKRRGRRVRKSLKVSASRPRLSVFRSNRYIYAQIIDDNKGVTIVSASEKEIDKTVTGKAAKAKLVGEKLAEKAIEKKVSKVAFDRGSYKYHGRVKALAEAVKEKGVVI